VRDDYERIRSTLVGITPINVVIRSTAGKSVVNTSLLAVVNEFVNEVRPQQGVGRVLSVVDPLAAVNLALIGEDELPDSADELEQYLLLLGGVEQLDDVLAKDRRATNVLLRLDDNSSDRIVALASWAESWLHAKLPDGYSASATGIMYEIARSEEEIAHGQVRGLLLAATAIGIVVLLLFRDFRTTLIAFVPNAVPLILAFGLMGILAVPLDAATVCLGAMALGIAVDDTVHVLCGFEEARAAERSVKRALDAAFDQALPALVFTTLAVGLSFSVIGLSKFTLVRNLGLLTSGTVFLALAADLTLLPALLSFRQPRGGKALK
jgi:predicted RND superfamily exporter protein